MMKCRLGPEGITRKRERKFYDTLGALNRARLEETGDPEILTRLNAYEMAYRMQTSAPELMDLGSESKHTLKSYGVKPGGALCYHNPTPIKKISITSKGKALVEILGKGQQMASFGISVIEAGFFGNEVFAELYASRFDGPPVQSGFTRNSTTTSPSSAI